MEVGVVSISTSQVEDDQQVIDYNDDDDLNVENVVDVIV